MDKDYLNPIYQGWLTKEGIYVYILAIKCAKKILNSIRCLFILCVLGGHKKSLRKRWCILSSRFFFYFEGNEVSNTHVITTLIPKESMRIHKQFIIIPQSIPFSGIQVIVEGISGKRG